MLPTLHLFGARVPSYFVTLLLAATLSLVLSFVLLRRTGIHPARIILILAACTAGSFVGARVLGIVSDVYYIYHPIRGPLPVGYLLRHGGLSLYGALLGGTASVALAAAALGVPVLMTLDRVVPVGYLGFGIGRAGCLMAGCCWGKPTLFPVALVFHDFMGKARPVGVPLHATQVYEAAAAILPASLLVFFLYRMKPRVGTVFAMSCIFYPAARFFLDDLRGAERIFLGGLSIMQWISIIFLCLGFTLLLAFHVGSWKKAARILPALLTGLMIQSCNPCDAMPRALCRSNVDCTGGEFCVGGTCRFSGFLEFEVKIDPIYGGTFEGDLILTTRKCRDDAEYRSCSGKSSKLRESLPVFPFKKSLRNMPRGAFLLVAVIDTDGDGAASGGDFSGFSIVEAFREGVTTQKHGSNVVMIRHHFRDIDSQISALSKVRTRMGPLELAKLWIGRK